MIFYMIFQVEIAFGYRTFLTWKWKLLAEVFSWALEKLHNVLFAYFWVTMLHEFSWNCLNLMKTHKMHFSSHEFSWKNDIVSAFQVCHLVTVNSKFLPIFLSYILYCNKLSGTNVARFSFIKNSWKTHKFVLHLGSSYCGNPVFFIIISLGFFC